jgi:hypothetical protein
MAYIDDFFIINVHTLHSQRDFFLHLLEASLLFNRKLLSVQRCDGLNLSNIFIKILIWDGWFEFPCWTEDSWLLAEIYLTCFNFRHKCFYPWLLWGYRSWLIKTFVDTGAVVVLYLVWYHNGIIHQVDSFIQISLFIVSLWCVYRGS